MPGRPLALTPVCHQNGHPHSRHKAHLTETSWTWRSLVRNVRTAPSVPAVSDGRPALPQGEQSSPARWGGAQACNFNSGAQVGSAPLLFLPRLMAVPRRGGQSGFTEPRCTAGPAPPGRLPERVVGRPLPSPTSSRDVDTAHMWPPENHSPSCPVTRPCGWGFETIPLSSFPEPYPPMCSLVFQPAGVRGEAEPAHTCVLWACV